MKTHLLTLLLLGLPLTGVGQLSEHTFLNPGDLTHDAVSGLEWLDTRYTWGVAYPDLDALTAPGSTFADFRLATVSEWTALYTGVGIPTVSLLGDPLGEDPLYWSRAAGLVETLGGFYTFSSATSFHRILGGLLRHPDDESSLGVGRLMVYDPLDTFPNAFVSDHYLGALTLRGPQTGAFLVREYPQNTGVPEPSTYGLAATLFLGCLLWLRKHRAILNGRDVAE